MLNDDKNYKSTIKYTKIYFELLRRKFFSLDLKLCRLPELVIQSGRLFHKIDDVTIVALVPESVLVRGICRSFNCLVLTPVCSLTVDNCKNHSGYTGNSLFTW